MAYRIYKKAAETEELQLFDESGQLSKTITVRLDRDGLAQKLSSSHTALLRARREALALSADMASGNTGKIEQAYENTGLIIIEMFEAVFGKEDSDSIREFYGQNVMQMCMDVMPFITEIVIPKVRKLAGSRQKQKLMDFRKKKFY